MTRQIVLVVEDTDDIRFMMKVMLESKGLRVVEAADGRQAMDRALEERPDLILMDLSMPVMDGWEATRRLRQSERTRDVPIVGLSAHCQGERLELAIRAGCNDCFAKPVTVTLLDEVVARFLPTR